MGRKKREWFAGAQYHITNRGTRRASLFYSDEDREVYLLMLAMAQKRFPFILHAYCLMTNHIHLQLQTIDDPPWKIMQFLNTSYGKYFNAKNHHSGHVFDNRYGSVLVTTKRYELELSKYIHLNPLKAGLAENLEEYRWSSFRTYALIEIAPFVTTDKILSYFNAPNSENYIHFLRS